MRPEPPAPDYLPDDAISWAQEQHELLEIVCDELLATGFWPSLSDLTRKLAQEGRPTALATVFDGMPRPLGSAEHYADRVVLSLYGLRMTHAGHKLVAGFDAVLRLAVERFGSRGTEPVITRANAARGTTASDPYVQALSEILLREAPFLGSGRGGPEDDWSREVTGSVVRYWNAAGVDGYLRTRAQELIASRQLGWGSLVHTASDARGRTEREVRHDHRDAFICHAGEDKDDVARPLAQALQTRGHSVWFDEIELLVGDSLSESINWGLAHSRFGVVILSRAFFDKPWPRRELRGLVARETAVEKRLILPVWHGIDQHYLAQNAPPLADVRAVSTHEGIEEVASQVSRAIQCG